jgi:acyl-CoA thioesterase I
MLKILLFALFTFATAWSAATAAGTILVYGDSLSAAYGIGQKEGWVTLLEERLKQRKLDYSVANASISGETTSGGAARIDDALARFKPDVVIVALGGNDGLRGLPVPEIKANLARIVGAAQARNARVLVAGMRMPPNYGAKYTQAFQ